MTIMLVIMMPRTVQKAFGRSHLESGLLEKPEKAPSNMCFHCRSQGARSSRENSRKLSSGQDLRRWYFLPFPVSLFQKVTRCEPAKTMMFLNLSIIFHSLLNVYSVASAWSEQKSGKRDATMRKAWSCEIQRSARFPMIRTNDWRRLDRSHTTALEIIWLKKFREFHLQPQESCTEPRTRPKKNGHRYRFVYVFFSARSPRQKGGSALKRGVGN